MQIENVPKEPDNVVKVLNISPEESDKYNMKYSQISLTDVVYNQRGGVSKTYLPPPKSIGVAMGGDETFIMAASKEPVKVPATKFK